jgi:asparagine synthetase B (glutamine-hydrolysing)
MSSPLGEPGIAANMCGIAGFTRLNTTGLWGVAERITEGLFHRGPDQQGVFEGSQATLCAVR